MSSDEQDAAIGRLVMDLGEAKRRRALLESNLRAAGDSLSSIGRALKHLRRDRTENIVSAIDMAPSICRLDKIRVMLQELKRVNSLIAQLNDSAAELGID